MADADTNERPQFARGSSIPGSNLIDLRADCPRSIVDVIDAVSLARDVPRTVLINEILAKWAEKVIHEASVVARVAGLNAVGVDTERTPRGARNG